MMLDASSPTLETARLRLRRWRAEDIEPFARINAHPEVMEFLPARLHPQASADLVAGIEEHFRLHGFGLWAVERRGTSDWIGYIGLHRPAYTAHFTPCVEIGWRLGREFWGQGYATEGARAALDYGFGRIGLEEIVAVTAVGNQRSRRVMEKLGMSRDLDGDFAHPRLPQGHPLRPHVLYRLRRQK